MSERVLWNRIDWKVTEWKRIMMEGGGSRGKKGHRPKWSKKEIEKLTEMEAEMEEGPYSVYYKNIEMASQLPGRSQYEVRAKRSDLKRREKRRRKSSQLPQAEANPQVQEVWD